MEIRHGYYTKILYININHNNDKEQL